MRGEAIAGTAHLEQYHCPCSSIVEVFYYQYYKLQIPVSQIALDKRKSVCIAFRRAQKRGRTPFPVKEESRMFVQSIASFRQVTTNSPARTTRNQPQNLRWTGWFSRSLTVLSVALMVLFAARTSAQEADQIGRAHV